MASDSVPFRMCRSFFFIFHFHFHFFHFHFHFHFFIFSFFHFFIFHFFFIHFFIHFFSIFFHFFPFFPFFLIYSISVISYFPSYPPLLPRHVLDSIRMAHPPASKPANQHLGVGGWCRRSVNQCSPASNCCRGGNVPSHVPSHVPSRVPDRRHHPSSLRWNGSQVSVSIYISRGFF